MLRRISLIFVAALAAVSLALALTVNWAYSEIFNTSKFVQTSDTIFQNSSVQEEVAITLVDSLTGDIQLPPVLLSPLNKLATQVVASDEFQEFWSQAIRAVHQPLVAQLRSDTPIDKVSASKVDLTEMVNVVLTDLRAQFPKLASLLPAEAPLTQFELLSGENLESARSIVRLATILRWSLIALALLLLSVLTILKRKSVRPTRVPAISLSVGAFMALITAMALPVTMQALVDSQYSNTARTVGSLISTSLRNQSLLLLIIGVSVVSATALQQVRARLMQLRSR
ncbi:MAG: hypothetical protein RL114_1370 [Actinomycetota bacterium]|jgi:hypothetical protein